MTNRWWQTAAGCIAAACLLASCGGGGGGDEVAAPDDFQVSFGRSSVTWNGPSGQAFTPEVIQVTSTGTPKDNLYVGGTTPDGNLDSNFQTPVITVDTIGRTARLSLSPRSNLLPGKYTGTLLAKVCRDIACARHYAGSPHALSYTIDVSDPPPPPHRSRSIGRRWK